MEKIYKVFVSSTYEDLREERAEVQKALLKLNCLPVGMELFPAADDETWEFIKGQIEDSDYYIVLIAGRYGSIAPAGRSFTEMEFDYAHEIKKPAIGFVHGNRGAISRDRSELDAERAQKLEEFIGKVRARPVRHFTTPHELALEVTTSFVDLKVRKPSIGFVRADQTVDFKRYAELLEKNQSLEERLSEFLKDSTKNISAMMSENINLFLNVNTNSDDVAPYEITWGELFLRISLHIAYDKTEHEMFSDLCREMASANRSATDPLDTSMSLSKESRSLIRARLFAGGFITVSTEQCTRSRYNFKELHPQLVDVKVWKLTEFGRTQLSLLATHWTD